MLPVETGPLMAAILVPLDVTPHDLVGLIRDVANTLRPE